MDDYYLSEADNFIWDCLRNGAWFALSYALKHDASIRGARYATGLLLYAVEFPCQVGDVGQWHLAMLTDADSPNVQKTHREALRIAYEKSHSGWIAPLLRAGVDTSVLGTGPVTDACLAIAVDDPLRLRSLLDAGVDVDARDEAGCPLIVRAALFKCVRCVALLVERGAEIDAVWAKDEAMPDGTAYPVERLTALAASARRADTVTASILLRKGASVQGGGERRHSPLMEAPLTTEGEAVATLLLDYGVDWTKTFNWPWYGERHADYLLPQLLERGLADESEILRQIFASQIEWGRWEAIALLRAHGHELTVEDAVLLPDRPTLERILGQSGEELGPEQLAQMLCNAVCRFRSDDEPDRVQVVELLLNAGASPLIESDHPYELGERRTAMSLAVENRVPESVLALLRAHVASTGGGDSRARSAGSRRSEEVG